MVGSNFEAFIAGKIETIIVIKIEHKDIINIESKLFNNVRINKKKSISTLRGLRKSV